MRPLARYAKVMFLLAAAAAVVLPADLARPRLGATAHAQAIVRIVSGVRLHFDKQDNEGAPRMRETVIRAADAQLQRAKLIEFE